MPRAVIYVRVSTQEQVGNLSLDTQEKACRSYCDREGWALERVYRERGESAKTTDRPQLQAMLDRLTGKRPPEFLVVYDLSRLTRDTYDYLAIKRTLEKHGVAIRAATQNLEDTAEGEFVQTVLAATNRLENELRRRKTIAGMKEACARGRWPWQAPYGYRMREGMLEPDPQAAPFVRLAFERAAAGMGVPEILSELAKAGANIPRATLHRIIQNPLYMGRLVCSPWGIDRDGIHAPVVDRHTFYKAGRAIARMPFRAYVTGSTEALPFRSFARCEACERGLSGYQKKRRYYYRCIRCQMNTPADRVHSDFARLLDSLASKTGVIERLRESVIRQLAGEAASADSEREALARRLEATRRRLRKLTDAMLDELVDGQTFKNEHAALKAQAADLEASISTRTPMQDCEQVIERAMRYLEAPLLLWDETDPAQRPALLRAIFPAGLTWERAGRFANPRKSLFYLPVTDKIDQPVSLGTPNETNLLPMNQWVEAWGAILAAA